jgi:hypothetical protein
MSAFTVFGDAVFEPTAAPAALSTLADAAFAARSFEMYCAFVKVADPPIAAATDPVASSKTATLALTITFLMMTPPSLDSTIDMGPF